MENPDLGPSESLMPESVSPKQPGDDISELNETRFGEIFAVAKEALTYIGLFRTPPTPEIYQLWYRFVEGADEKLRAELSKAMDARAINSSQLDELYHRYFPTSVDFDTHAHIGNSLAEQLAAVQELLQEQSQAQNEFGHSVQSTRASLRAPALDSAALSRCVEQMLASNSQMQSKLADTDRRLNSSQQQIQSLQSELHQAQKAMFTDNLTGVSNRRFFDLLMLQTTAGSSRSAETSAGLCVLTLIDMDGFKRINDSFGHAAADEVLRHLASVMQRIVGAGSLARLGGDEFAVVHRVDTFELADQLAEDLRKSFSAKQLVLQRSGITIGSLTASMGVAVLRDDDDHHSWFERADKLLYAAKNAGRNRVMLEPRRGRV